MTERKSYSSNKFLLELPYLIEVQKASYDHFLQANLQPNKRLNAGLERVFRDKFPMQDAKGLNVREATVHPRATENIEQIQGIISSLMENGYAYEAGGDVYYRAKKFEGYGKLSHQPLENLEAVRPGEAHAAHLGHQLAGLLGLLHVERGRAHAGTTGGALLAQLVGTDAALLGLAAIAGWSSGGVLPPEMMTAPLAVLFCSFFARNFARALRISSAFSSGAVGLQCAHAPVSLEALNFCLSAEADYGTCPRGIRTLANRLR